MSRRGVRMVVLCEDEAHRRFSYQVFLKLGYHPRELYFHESPTGRGAAEHWVRERYPVEVEAYRRNVHTQRIGLLVLIDADNRTVEQRHRELDAALREKKLQSRAAQEVIVLFVPRRHIETWIAFLVGHQVDETNDCKGITRGVDYRDAAHRFVELHHHGADRSVGLPSMETAFNELTRLD